MSYCNICKKEVPVNSNKMSIILSFIFGFLFFFGYIATLGKDFGLYRFGVAICFVLFMCCLYDLTVQSIFGHITCQICGSTNIVQSKN